MNKEVKFDADMSITRSSEVEGTWVIEGIATTADLDVDGLYISEEALIGAENDLKKYTTLLYNHDRDKEIGKILEVNYDPEQRALMIKALISKTVPDIWQKVQEGVLNKFSVSGTALDFTEKFIKGLDKVVQYVNQMRLFETSLVTVPADASARTLAFYVEKSMKEINKESKMASKKVKKEEKKIEKSQEEDVKKEETLNRDAKALDILVTSVEDALNSEERDVQTNTLRSVLDFLKALEATSTDSVEKSVGLSVDDITKAVSDVLDAKLEDLKETQVALSKTVIEVAKVEMEDADNKKEEEIAKAKEDADEEAEKEIAKSKEDEETKISSIERGLSALTDLVKDSLPIRKGRGSEEHKEDNRDNSDEAEDFTKGDKYRNATPSDKFGMLLDAAGHKD